MPVLKAPKGMDLRQFDANGRFVCNEAHPWNGNRESAPRGVRHERAEKVSAEWKCPDCGSTW